MQVRRLFLVAALVMLAALTVMASDGPEGGQVKSAAVKSMVMGPTVKNAPYSGEEVTTSDQMLADGTKIHNESRTKVYRDSEGRVRRDTADHIQILDPVAGVSYMLDPKTMTATMVSFYINFTTSSKPDGPVFFKSQARTGGDGSGGPASATPATISVSRGDGVVIPRTTSDVGVVIAGGAGPEPTLAEMDAAKKMKAALAGDGQPGDMLYLNGVSVTTKKVAAGKKEQLPSQVIEGVLSEGTRTTNTLAAGAIGNDREINIVAERWYSPDLKTVMVSEHSDPRSGKDSFRLTGVSRNEPDPALFLLPAGYKLTGQKAPVQ